MTKTNTFFSGLPCEPPKPKRLDDVLANFKEAIDRKKMKRMSPRQRKEMREREEFMKGARIVAARMQGESVDE